MTPAQHTILTRHGTAAALKAPELSLEFNQHILTLTIAGVDTHSLRYHRDLS